jgi:predicted ATPase/DNA-binding SARP family transcriptional activator
MERPVPTYGLLGPLVPSVGAGKRPALLALLLLSANRVVTTDRLIDELWHGDPPPTAGVALQNGVAQLRRRLGPDAIVTHPGGYELRVAPGALDVHRFERALADAAEAVAARRHADALERLDAALALWRGPPLADVAYEPFAVAEAERLEELRLGALEQRFDCELALGRHAATIAPLRTLIAEHPLRERLRAQLMLALYAGGQQADALAVYRDARRMLVDNLGLEPGPELRRIEQAILAQRPLPVRPGGAARAVPAPATPLVGRAAELAAVTELLRSGARVITLTGAGGMGKTRLALEAAAQADAFVDLARATEAGEVAPAVALALGVAPDELDAQLRARDLLVILDNLEQVAGAAGAVGALITTAPRLTVLATSRHALGLAGEHELPLPPLALPDAVALFVQRASARAAPAGDASAVAEICRRLDRMPLAIELAARWSRVLAPAQLLARLEHRLDMAAQGAEDRPERQRTLRATIDWSHRLLEPAEQRLLARLAVFAGGWTVEAAEAVCPEPGTLERLAALVDRSLVATDAAAGRFALLETIREYALERLAERGEEAPTRTAHARWALALAEAAHPELVGRDQDRWYERLDAEHANLREALAWSLEHDRDVALLLAGALWRFWQQRGHLAEGREWLGRALATGAVQGRARARYGLGVIAYYLGDTAEAERLWAAALEEHRARGDARAVASTLNDLAMLAQYRGEHAEAERLYGEALAGARADGAARSIAVSLTNLGSLANDRGEFTRARELLEEALARFQAQGDGRAAADVTQMLGAAAAGAGDHARAEALCEESLTHFRRLGDATGVIEVTQRLGVIARERGDRARAGALFADALERSRDTGYTWGVAFALDELARLALADGDRERARELVTEALALHRRHEHAPGVEAALQTLAAATEVAA